MKPEHPPRARVIVKKGHGGGHHGGAWKVAYADFVTTMMALFIVLWIIGQNSGTREAIARYFRDPGAFPHKHSRSLMKGSDGLLSAEPTPGGDDPQSREEHALREAAVRFRETMAEMGLLEVLRNQVRIEVTPEGLRIELIERDGSPFFELGSAAMVPGMKAVLENIARAVNRLPNHITVEGHTDGRQFTVRENYSNWELSTDRTNSARRIMEAAGLSPGKIDRLVGHADRLPLVPDDRMNAANRRITILVRRATTPGGR